MWGHSVLYQGAKEQVAAACMSRAASDFMWPPPLLTVRGHCPDALGADAHEEELAIGRDLHTTQPVLAFTRLFTELLRPHVQLAPKLALRVLEK